MMNPFELRQWWIENYPRMGIIVGLIAVGLISASTFAPDPLLGCAMQLTGEGFITMGSIVAGLDLGFILSSSHLSPYLPSVKNANEKIGLDINTRIVAYTLLIVAGLGNIILQ